MMSSKFTPENFDNISENEKIGSGQIPPKGSMLPGKDGKQLI